MSIIKHLSTQGLDYADQYIELQEVLSNISKQNIKAKIKQIFKTKFVENEEQVAAMIENIISVIPTKPNIIHIIGEFCSSFLESTKMDTPPAEFGKLILKRVLRFVNDTNYQQKVPEYLLLREMVDNEIFTDRDYLPIMNELYKMSFYNQFCLMFLCFAKEIEEENEELYDSVLPVIQELSDNKQIDDKLCYLIQNIDKLSTNSWRLLRSGVDSDLDFAIIQALKEDDATKLKSIVKDVNMTLHFNLFEPCRILQNTPTLLQTSIFFGAVKCFKYLHDHKSKMHRKDKVGWDCGLYVICGGNLEILDIVEKFNINFNKTLSYAAIYRQYDMVEWLLEKRAKDIGDTQKELRNVLCASARSNNFRCFLNCLERHQKVRNKDRKGENALIAATSGGWKHFVEFVLMFDNCDINSTDSHGRSALMIAAQEGFIDILTFLIQQKGVSYSMRDEDGATAYHLAAGSGQYQSLRMLMKFSDPNCIDHLGRTPLHYACESNYAACVQILLKNKANPNIQDCNGKKPIQLATEGDVIAMFSIEK